MLSDVNRNPRRWVDGSGKVRVVEGWHPSAPGQVGYNLIVDDDWYGTFASLEEAAAAAAARAAVDDDQGVSLRPYPELPARGRKRPATVLRLVPPTVEEHDPGSPSS
jgi:hypothetical protein